MKNVNSKNEQGIMVKQIKELSSREAEDSDFSRLEELVVWFFFFFWTPSLLLKAEFPALSNQD